ncbi:hypothetical protein VL03_12685 [Rossellomorea marisflavi]|nr:hypothetical protein VL03_12685 [Rossellomorea marisflavi]
MKPRDCANLGHDNRCLLRDAHCPLLVKHERYSFDKADLRCSWLDGVHIADNKLVVQAAKPAVKESSKACRGCGKIFKTGNNRLWYCSDVCRSIAKSKSERKSRANKQDFRDLKR